uniref:Uncharacterized protein n=1 Tax=Octopus bimaculoides TaxID=37653 RepID=A0A0L8H246_OCTBM
MKDCFRDSSLLSILPKLPSGLPLMSLLTHECQECAQTPGMFTDVSTVHKEHRLCT